MESGTDYPSSGTPTWSELAEVVGRNHINTRWIGVSSLVVGKYFPLDFSFANGLQHQAKS